MQITEDDNKFSFTFTIPMSCCKSYGFPDGIPVIQISLFWLLQILSRRFVD
jgi:hypothetical protein